MYVRIYYRQFMWFVLFLRFQRDYNYVLSQVSRTWKRKQSLKEKEETVQMYTLYICSYVYTSCMHIFRSIQTVSPHSRLVAKLARECQRSRYGNVWGRKADKLVNIDRRREIANNNGLCIRKVFALCLLTVVVDEWVNNKPAYFFWLLLN